MNDRDRQLDDDAEGRPRREGRTLAEWVIFGVSSALVLGVALVLLLAAILGPDGGPRFELEVLSSERIGDRYHVGVEVHNEGGQAAASVRVHAELALADRTVEADETVDALAPGGDSTVTFVFADDPSAGELTIDIRSFQEP